MTTLTELDREKIREDILRSLDMTPLERLEWLEEVQALTVLAHGSLQLPFRQDRGS